MDAGDPPGGGQATGLRTIAAWARSSKPGRSTVTTPLRSSALAASATPRSPGWPRSARRGIAIGTDNSRPRWPREFGADVVVDAVGRADSWRHAFHAPDLAGARFALETFSANASGWATSSARLKVAAVKCCGR